ncbi:MAG: stalk domain-containing protein, partial [Candidatus Paceibacterota bacterium]
RTYLPLRAIGDALGVKVNWNDAKKQVEVGEPPKITPTPVKDVQPTPNIVLGKNEFLSRYNAVAPYDFKITVLGKVGEDLTKSVPYEVWQFKFENVRNQDMTFQISSLGWNQGTTLTTVGTLGYPPITRKTLKPGESFTGCAAFGTAYKGHQDKIMFSYGAGKVFYEE